MWIDRWSHPNEGAPGNYSWWPLRQCAPMARLSLAIKFCSCHQGLDTFTGDGILVLRKSRLSVHLMNTAGSQEFFGPSRGKPNIHIHTCILCTYIFSDTFLLTRPDCVSAEYFEVINCGMYSPKKTHHFGFPETLPSPTKKKLNIKLNIWNCNFVDKSQISAVSCAYLNTSGLDFLLGFWRISWTFLKCIIPNPFVILKCISKI